MISQVEKIANVISFAGGESFSAAVDSMGQLFMWGLNSNNVICKASNQTRFSTPQLVPLPSVVSNVCCGGWHAVAYLRPSFNPSPTAHIPPPADAKSSARRTPSPVFPEAHSKICGPLSIPSSDVTDFALLEDSSPKHEQSLHYRQSNGHSPVDHGGSSRVMNEQCWVEGLPVATSPLVPAYPLPPTSLPVSTSRPVTTSLPVKTSSLVAPSPQTPSPAPATSFISNDVGHLLHRITSSSGVRGGDEVGRPNPKTRSTSTLMKITIREVPLSEMRRSTSPAIERESTAGGRRDSNVEGARDVALVPRPPAPRRISQGLPPVSGFSSGSSWKK